MPLGIPGEAHDRERFMMITRSTLILVGTFGAAVPSLGLGWQCEVELLPADPRVAAHFGSSVSLDGDLLLIGAQGADKVTPDGPVSTGAVYVFQRAGGTWTQVDKIVPSDGEIGERFGGAVSLDGDRALIGAWGDDDNEPQSGSAYVFERVGGSWLQIDKLLASDGEYDDRFGQAVSLDGGTAVVGAFGDDFDTGSAYVFVEGASGWLETQKLVASNASVSARFGQSVAVQGDRALI